VAERGVPATILFVAAMVSLAIGCWKSSAILGDAPPSWEQSLEPLCAIAIMTAMAVVGSLDTVLQLGAPTMIFFLAIGALTPQQVAFASPSLSRDRLTLAVGLPFLPLILAAVMALFTLDGIYADFLIARGGGDDLQVASRIAFDADWVNNEIIWASFVREIKERAAAAGRLR